MNYSENLKPIASNYDNEINSKDLLQSQIGKLLWMSGQTRPDIAFDVCQLGTNFKYSDDKDITYPNKIFAHQKQETVQITNQNMGNDCNLELSIFADASHDNLNDGWKSTRLFNYSSRKWWKMFKLLNWQSKQINWVVKSTLVAEILALNDAVDDGIYISEIVSELLFHGTKSLPIEIYTNTKSLYDAIKSKKKHFRKKIKV